MTVAFDASAGTTGTGTLSYTHTPVGTPRAVLLFVVHSGTTDEVTTVTYGGTGMTQISVSPQTKSTGELSVVHAFFLGSSIPTGAQTVEVSVSGASTKLGRSITLTASADTEVVDADIISSDSVSNPSVTLGLGGRTSFVAIGFDSGQIDVASIAPNAGWTSRVEFDFGSHSGGVYTYDTIGSSDVAAGWDNSAAGGDDANAIAVAISEAAAATAVRRTLSALGTRSGSRQMVRL